MRAPEFQLKLRFGTHGNWKNQMAPRILTFSIAIGAYYSYEMKNSEI